MKIAHKLASAEHISRQEMQKVLSGSLQSTNFPVEPHQMEQMVDGIMKVKERTDWSTWISVTVVDSFVYWYPPSGVH